MAKKILVLMCGTPGGGKTTWVNSIMGDANECPVYHISRDVVRFSMLGESDEYFSKENAVFAEWIRQIQAHLDSPEDCYIIADATHLNERSRNKTLDALTLPDDVKILPVIVNPDLKTCLERNAQRTGRALVPRSVVKRMYFSFEAPTEQEKYKYWSILFVKPLTEELNDLANE